MYNHEAVQTNLQLLRDRGYYVIEPEEGRLASGAMGTGRLPEPETILACIADMVPGWQHYLGKAPGPEADSGRSKSLTGLRVLVTAGPTREYLDPARFLSNPSSGRMGYEVARAAQAAGASVVLVSGPVELDAPSGVELLRVTSADEMASEVLGRFEDVDIVFKAAAVADYAPAVRHHNKLKKEKSSTDLVLRLRRTTDILKQLGERKQGQLLIGFAAESDDPIENGRAKLERKNLDLIVVNDITSRPGH